MIDIHQFVCLKIYLTLQRFYFMCQFTSNFASDKFDEWWTNFSCLSRLQCEWNFLLVCMKTAYYFTDKCLQIKIMPPSVEIVSMSEFIHWTIINTKLIYLPHGNSLQYWSNIESMIFFVNTGIHSCIIYIIFLSCIYASWCVCPQLKKFIIICAIFLIYNEENLVLHYHVIIYYNIYYT